MFGSDSPVLKFFSFAKKSVELLPADVLDYFGIIVTAVIAAALLTWILSIL